MSYIGRFAPSPTGPLHFGSLIAALASFLDARAHKGKWLLRIEDLDPPREQPELKQQFPIILEQFGLYWDAELELQSQRLQYYEEALEQLLAQGDAYPCNCSRKQITERTQSTAYDSYCRNQPPQTSANCAIRACCHAQTIQFQDLIQGPQYNQLAESSGDFVIFRRDGLFAYQLAVVVDDFLQGITQVVRGSDLLNETPRQIQLQQLLGYPTPNYAHIPVASNPAGQKLSKQTFAQAIQPQDAVELSYKALTFLGQDPDQHLRNATQFELIEWAITHWNLDRIPKVLNINLRQGS